MGGVREEMFLQDAFIFNTDKNSVKQTMHSSEEEITSCGHFLFLRDEEFTSWGTLVQAMPGLALGFTFTYGDDGKSSIVFNYDLKTSQLTKLKNLKWTN